MASSMMTFVQRAASSTSVRQAEVLNNLIVKHLQDPAYTDFAKSDDFTRTSTERGIQRWEHAHLIAALDTLNAYQRDRRCRSNSHAPGFRRQYTSDPRTRLIELLKRWLRTHAASSDIDEEEVRRVCGLCRDILNHTTMFPSRNPRSFVKTIAEVYEKLKWQLREVLGRDRSCAMLVDRAIMLSRNLLSDAIGYLLLAPTEFKQTDTLPSLEAVSLWQALPEDRQVLVDTRADPAMQRATAKVWTTHAGSIVAALLSSPWSVRFFGLRGGTGTGKTQAIADSPASKLDMGAEQAKLPALIAKIRGDWARGEFKNSGLAGSLRTKDQDAARQNYLEAATCIADLAYLLGVVLTQFHRIGDGLGDYGMIRMAECLHLFLKALEAKVKELKTQMEQLNTAVVESFVLARARGASIPKPAPSERMLQRAHEAFDRAVDNRGDGHAQALLSALEQLRARSAPDRLPALEDSLSDACLQLQAAFGSADFLARVGDEHRDDFAKIAMHCGPPPMQEQQLQLQGPASRQLALPAPEVQAASTVAIEDVSSPPAYGGFGLAPPTFGAVGGAPAPAYGHAAAPVTYAAAPVTYAEAPVTYGAAPALPAQAMARPPALPTTAGASPPARAVVAGMAASGGAYDWPAPAPRPSTGGAVVTPAAVELPSPGAFAQRPGGSGSLRGASPSRAAAAVGGAWRRALSPMRGRARTDEAAAERSPVVPPPAAPRPVVASAPAVAVVAKDATTNPFATDLTPAAAGTAAGDTNPFELEASPPAPQAEPGARASFNPFEEEAPAEDDRATAGVATDAAAGRLSKASAPASYVREVSEAAALPPVSLLTTPEMVKGEPAEDMGASVSIKATVGRLTTTRSRFKWHDRRMLSVTGGQVDIFGPGSTAEVKLSLRIAEDVEECTLQRAADSQQKILFLSVRRPLKGRPVDDGVKEQKLYYFEFDTAEAAAEFHSSINARRRRRGGA